MLLRQGSLNFHIFGRKVIGGSGLHIEDANDRIAHQHRHGQLGFFFSSRRRHTRCLSDWSSDVCSSDLWKGAAAELFVIPGLAVLVPGSIGLRSMASLLEAHTASVGVTSAMQMFLIAMALVAGLLFGNSIEIGRASCRERVYVMGVAYT